MTGIASQFGKYLLVGSLGGAWHMASVFALTEWVGFYYMMSAAFAVGTTAMINFSLNRIWTFKQKVA